MDKVIKYKTIGEMFGAVCTIGPSSTIEILKCNVSDDHLEMITCALVRYDAGKWIETFPVHSMDDEIPDKLMEYDILRVTPFLPNTIKQHATTHSMPKWLQRAIRQEGTHEQQDMQTYEEVDFPGVEPCG